MATYPNEYIFKQLPADTFIYFNNTLFLIVSVQVLIMLYFTLKNTFGVHYFLF